MVEMFCTHCLLHELLVEFNLEDCDSEISVKNFRF